MGSARMACAAIAVPPDPPAADDARHARLPLDPGFERLRHGRDRRAAVAREDAGGAARMIEGNLDRRDVGARRLAAGGEIDQPRAHAAVLQDVAHQAQLVALGIERARDDHIGLAHWRLRGRRPLGQLGDPLRGQS